uniref:CSON004337 protein n=1 Tax=Culicoides sonorensis TaxID=179676 RepID=A0A336MQQ5_CULSO
MEGNFERLNLGNPESNNYVPFDQFIQNYGITQSPINSNGVSNLTVTAPEFVPINRREENISENGSDYVASYQPESMNRITENERKKGAIRKQYTNNNHRTYPNNQRHHQNSHHHHNHNQQQYKEYNRSRYYGDSDRDTNRSYNGNNNYDNNWRRRDEIRKPPGGSQRDFHKNRNNKSERSDFKFNKYTKSQNFSSKKSPETQQHPKFDTSNCSQREKLTKEIENSLLECMICCENIKSAQSVFSCQSCFHIFHLNCITKWANSSFAEGWRCPACNSFNDVVPKEYFCFCGKLKDPHYNRNDIPHSCGEVCGRFCEKGDHKCTLQCHPGPCDQCQATVTRYCNCKKSSKVMQCCQKEEIICKETCNQLLNCLIHRCTRQCHKVPCGTKKPACDKPCPRTHPCSHPVLHNCHTASKCPPCVILTTKYCYGKHEQRKTIPCSEESFSCGLACGKNLNCGRHKCLKVCHKEEKCLKDGDICKQRCTKTRLDCGHQCGASCHEGDCPDVICKENVEITCECGNRKQTRICHDLSREYRRITNAQLASSMMDIQNGGAIKLSEIMGPIKKNGTRTLECNDDCKLLERNRRLEMAFGPSTEPVKQTPAYSDFIKSYAKKDMNLIKDIHEKLTNLVKLAKESKQKSRSHSFPVMNREKRQVVHEMCEAFGIQSQAYDAEPNRNVVATAQKDLSFCPTMSLMEVMNRENGQRIRLPMSQSAWRLPSVK